MPHQLQDPTDVETLRAAIRTEYSAVANHPELGFHFHTGRPLADRLGYRPVWYAGLPDAALASFAGTGNPFGAGCPVPGARVVDVGCGAGFDALIAGRMVGPTGAVVGVEMTPAMRTKARQAVSDAGLEHVEIRAGVAEALPVPDGWADIVISNGVLNLVPDKRRALTEMARILRPGGRLQIGDIMVQRPVSEAAKARIDLWTG